MQAGLMKVKTKTSKFEAQLEFRKKVFEQNPVDKCFTQKKGNQIEEVCSNLHKLFPPTPGCDKEGVFGTRIKHDIK